jgi:hypothetical protein
MMRFKIEPDFDTRYIILYGILHRGEIRIVKDLVRGMTRRGYDPSGPLSGLINRSFKSMVQSRVPFS